MKVSEPALSYSRCKQGVAYDNMADRSSTSANRESPLQQRFVYKVVLTGGIYCYVYVQQNCLLGLYGYVYTCKCLVNKFAVFHYRV